MDISMNRDAKNSEVTDNDIKKEAQVSMMAPNLYRYYTYKNVAKRVLRELKKDTSGNKWKLSSKKNSNGYYEIIPER